MLNLAARLIINILIPDLETFLKSHYNSAHYSTSSFMEHENKFFNYNLICDLQFYRNNKPINIEIYSSSFNDEQKSSFINYLTKKLYDLNVVLNFISNSNFKVNLKKTINNETQIEKKIRLDVSFKEKNNDLVLSLLIPVDFLKLFSRKITAFNIEFFEDEILKYFGNPKNYFPNLGVILNTLEESEIQKLFYHLQKKNMLTRYQISLMLLSFPQHTLLIKNNLSSNIVKDVDKSMKNFTVNKRDLIGGIYSIEESIFISMKNNDNFTFSGFMANMQKWMRIFLNSRLVLKRNFISWIKEIDSSGKFYQTVACTKDDVLAKSISDNPDIYYNVFSKHFPEKRIKEIFSISKAVTVSVFERIESQANFILNYKKIKIKKMNIGYEAFQVILRKIDKNELIYLLFGVGWFILSTAFKNINKNKVVLMIENLPLGARYLIIDVLQGIVNPNIIHDEMQINKARSVCVNELISLYQDGIIDFLN